MQHIDAAQMRAVADFPSLVDWLEASHREPAGKLDDLLLTQPAEGGGEDSLLVRAAWQRGEALGVKLVTVVPGNIGGPLPSVQGVYVLFDGKDGRALAILDGTELTYWKTAADSALGARLLAREDCAHLLMVGAGALAPHLIRAHCAVRPSIHQVSIWNRTPERAGVLAALTPVEGVEFRAVPALEAAVRGADIISCATMAETPLVHGDWLRGGQHLDLVGGFTPAMREADDAALRRARVFVDSRETTLEACGDISQPLAAGVIADDDIEADLYALCQTGLVRERAPGDITLYKNGGGGHLDLMTARYLVARLGLAK